MGPRVITFAPKNVTPLWTIYDQVRERLFPAPVIWVNRSGPAQIAAVTSPLLAHCPRERAEACDPMVLPLSPTPLVRCVFSRRVVVNVV